DAPDGSHQNPDHHDLCATHRTGRLPAVCPRRGATYPVPSCPVMRHHCPLHHPWEPLFTRSAESLTTALSDGTRRLYQGAFRNFLRYLAAHHPKIRRLHQLRRDPHVLGWLADLRSHTPPLAKITIVIRVTFLKRMLEDLAWNEQIPALAHLLSRADIPRRDETFPRPLLPEQ